MHGAADGRAAMRRQRGIWRAAVELPYADEGVEVIYLEGPYGL